MYKKDIWKVFYMDEAYSGIYDLKAILSRRGQASFRKQLHDLTMRIHRAHYVGTVEELTLRKVIFEETIDNRPIQFEVVYRYLSPEIIDKLLSEHTIIDLSGCYVDTLAISKGITSITADMLFVFGKAEFQNLTIERRFSFSGAFFREDTYFANIKLVKDGCFKWSHFNHSVHFHNIECPNTLNLTEAYIADGDMKRCHVSGMALFTGSRFSSSFYFRYNKIDGKTDFSKASFSGIATFKNSNLGKQCSFSESHFSEDVDYSSISPITELQFNDAWFESSVFFKDIVFKGGVFFNNASAELLQFSHCYFKEDSSLTFFSVNHLYFENCSFYCNLILSINRESTPTALLFYKVSNYGGIYIDWKKDRVHESIKRGVKVFFLQNKQLDPCDDIEVAELTMLERNFRLLSQSANEDLALVARKRAEALNTIFPKKHIQKAIDWSSEYGTNPEKCLICSLLVIALFGIIYFLLGKCSVSAFSQELNFWDCLCYSASAFITSSYGNISALSPLSSSITILEGFLGVFTAAYFTTIVARKILR